MSTHATFACFALLLLALCTACEGGDVAVFSGASAGVAGNTSGRSAGRPAGVGGAEAGASQSGSAEAGADDEAGAPPTDMLCHRSEECPAGRFCAKLGCQDGLGICEPQPLLCGAEAAPVCGCNHVTYWNDCLRRQHGVMSATAGECEAGAKACTSNAECDRGTCAHLLLPPASCDTPSGPGTCWVTPDDCSMTSDRRGWLRCPPPQNASGGNGPCASTCEALHDGRPYVALDGGATCP